MCTHTVFCVKSSFNSPHGISSNPQCALTAHLGRGYLQIPLPVSTQHIYHHSHSHLGGGHRLRSPSCPFSEHLGVPLPIALTHSLTHSHAHLGGGHRLKSPSCPFTEHLGVPLPIALTHSLYHSVPPTAAECAHHCHHQQQ